MGAGVYDSQFRTRVDVEARDLKIWAHPTFSTNLNRQQRGIHVHSICQNIEFLLQKISGFLPPQGNRNRLHENRFPCGASQFWDRKSVLWWNLKNRMHVYTSCIGPSLLRISKLPLLFEISSFNIDPQGFELVYEHCFLSAGFDCFQNIVCVQNDAE